MSDPPSLQWIPEGAYHGHYGDFSIHAAKFGNPQEGTAWHIMSGDESGNVRDYWVSGSEIWGCVMHIFDPSAGGGNSLQMFPLEEGQLKKEEKHAILDAISDWSKRQVSHAKKTI